MKISEQPNLVQWAPTLLVRTVGHLRYHEGVYHSPFGSVECFSQESVELNAPTAPDLTDHVSAEAPFTQLRMVAGGVGWEYREAAYYASDKLPRVASTFARRVAAQVAATKAPKTAPAEPDAELYSLLAAGGASAALDEAPAFTQSAD